MATLNRRAFMAGAAAAAGLATSSAVGLGRARATDPAKPNVLVIIVDEMRAPQWFPSTAELDRLLPNIGRIRRKAVSFTQHYTAANDCTPARGALLTGLYPHQTGVMLTSQSTLDAGFPTWGSMMRRFGYRTSWWGKWHLGKASDTTPGGLGAYGFDGGTYPSPNGTPNQGLHADPGIADQFLGWFEHHGDTGPWCTTVSFVNPHDVQYWPRWTKSAEMSGAIPQRFAAPPGNCETREQLRRNKPGLQSALYDISELTFGAVEPESWNRILDVYLWVQQQVDIQVGRVLDGLYARPAIAANTVVIFTADHGDYAGSHGLHGKGGGAYDEAIRVPLYVHDPRGVYGNGHTATERAQLSSSVDLTPFLVTLAAGGNRWRAEPRYAHLAGRYDIAGVCRNPRAAGRPWLAHVTDEYILEEAAIPFAGNAPAHVVALRTKAAKLAVYSHWHDHSLVADAGGQEIELYDYSTGRGRMELDNLGDRTPIYRRLRHVMDSVAIPEEIAAPLPSYLHSAQEAGLADYFSQRNLGLVIAGLGHDAIEGLRTGGFP